MDSDGSDQSADRTLQRVFFRLHIAANQAVSIESQRRINEKRKQVPDIRDVPALILRKSRSLLSGISRHERKILSALGSRAMVLTGSCDKTPAIADESVALVVTSPPFLDVVDYKADNWLRCWFNDIDPDRSTSGCSNVLMNGRST